MMIGIDASRAFLKRRTGIEEYAYQVIRHLRESLPESDEVVLYLRKKWAFQAGRLELIVPQIDFPLPPNWKVRGLWAPRFWTQGRLSLEMLFGKRPDILFVPAHTIPLIHPKKTVVVIHGLEYEVCPHAYSFWERLYMRSSIRFSARAAERVIAVSENTKRDVVQLYGVPEGKIAVIGEGFAPLATPFKRGAASSEPYLLFIGRLEERKNIVRLIEAFEILKERFALPHRLILAGKWGYGARAIQEKIAESRYREAIRLPGYIPEEEKWTLLRGASAFVFPSQYEGFGIPVLEAQSAEVPVVTSDRSSLPEVGGKGAAYVDPESPESIAEGILLVLRNEGVRNDILQEGTKNLERFGWRKTARAIAELFEH